MESDSFNFLPASGKQDLEMGKSWGWGRVRWSFPSGSLNLTDTRANYGCVRSGWEATEAGTGQPNPFPRDPGSWARPTPGQQSSAEGLATRIPIQLEAGGGEGGRGEGKGKKKKNAPRKGRGQRSACAHQVPGCSTATKRGPAGRGWGEATETWRFLTPSLHVARQRPSQASPRVRGP